MELMSFKEWLKEGYKKNLDAKKIKGKEFVLKELPDGSSSKYYKLTKGKKYKILDIIGSNAVVKADDGEQVSFALSRFNLKS